MTNAPAQSLVFLLNRSLDYVIPAGCMRLGEDHLRRARLAVCISLVAALALSALSISIFASSGVGTPAVASATGAVLFVLCPLLLRVSGSLVVVGNTMMAVLFMVIALSSLRTGGIGLPATFSAGVLPLTAALVAGRRSGAFWGVAVFSGVVALHFLHVNGYAFQEAPSAGAAYGRQFHGALVLIFVLSADAVLYEWLKSRAVDALADRNQSLETTSRELREARARSDAILEAAGEGIFGLDLEGRVTSVNPAATRMIGWEKGELMGRAMHPICHHSRSDGFHYAASECPILSTLQDGKSCGVTDEIFWRKDGTYFPVEYTCDSMRDGFGGLAGAVVIFRDVSERTRVAEMGTILDKSQNEIYVFHAESLRFVHVNQGALRNLKYSMGDLRELTPVDLKPEFSRPELEKLLEPLRARTQDAVKLTTVHRRKDGTLYPIEVHLQLSTFESQPVFLAIILDISQRKMLEAQLLRAQKLESIGRLAAGVAHEINTPIQFVGDNLRFLESSFHDVIELESGYFALLEACREDRVTPELLEKVDLTVADADRDFLVDEIPRAISQTLDGVQRVAKIVAAMKDFSHPGTGDAQETVDLKRAIESTIAVAAAEWKRVAEISTNFAAEMPAVPCFRQEFNQVILALVVNAAHAIAEAGGCDLAKGTITIATQADDEWAEVRVTDTGAGIPVAIRDKVFDPFFTTKEVGKGTGQGLSIAYQAIVERHGGALSFETEIGQGTTFIIRLPRSGLSSQLA